MQTFDPRFYSDIIYETRMFKSDTSKLVKSLENVIYKGYEIATIANHPTITASPQYIYIS